MRILHVVTAFPRGPDDPIAPWLVELLQRLRGAGHDIEVFTSAYKGSADQSFSGIPVHRFRYFFRRWENLTHEETAPDRMRRNLLYRVMPLFFVVAGMLAVWRLTRRHQYDVIHVHWPLPLALFGWAAQRSGQPPVVTTFYGVELRWVKHVLKPLKWFIKWAARRSAKVVAISSYTANELRELVNVPVAVIPYTASLPPPSASHPSAGGASTILFVGRLVERKGVSHLIEALGRLKRRDARLVIVGDGPERARLEALSRQNGVASRVEFRGKVSDADLQRAYQQASAFVLPSVLDARGDTEGLGVVLLEAMNYGVPVVASKIGGIVDIVADRESGLLVRAGDPGALAAALDQVLGSPDEARRLGENGRRRLREEFSWDAIVARWDALYRSL
ncbi:MAG TPA: glycosyltransferase family 4 protein [Gemmatimonadales bacterium]|nr:glycosyltransferase family 4 protein [Gemmatimonadales bacterium]